MMGHVKVLPNRECSVTNSTERNNVCVCLKNEKKLTYLSLKYKARRGRSKY